MSEISSLDSRAQRGRIPRRRYKVQRQSLELRLTYLNQTISDTRETLRNAGGSYSESIRQLESAEVDLNEIELSIKTMETRHEIGELPLEAYRKQLTDLDRRKTKIENTINGLLLRLRGEAR
jgi:chromosome segregation ATPase